jgi:hypothetical protein
MEFLYVSCVSPNPVSIANKNHKLFVFMETVRIKPKQVCIIFPVYDISNPSDSIYQNVLEVYNNSKKTLIVSKGINLSLLTRRKNVHHLVSSTPNFLGIADTSM